MNKTRYIPVAAPMLIGNEKTYVLDCLESTWISSNGKYLEKFESEFADFCGSKHAIACCNGTAALHLALMALGISAGDEVLVPTLTYIATANAVVYCGGVPVFVDSEPETWNIDPALLEAKITPRTKAIIVVHLYGHPANLTPIISIARKHNLFIIEDAAEAHGAEYKGQKVGSIGDIAAFSFFGNKIITCGEGGMVVTNDSKLANDVRLIRGQGMDPKRRYWFPVIGYNYRMTNIAAAIGLAQLERIEWHLEHRLQVVDWYESYLRGVSAISWQFQKPWAKHVYWMFSILLNDSSLLGRDQVMISLRERGIETRPVFYPIHVLPPYHDSCRGGHYPVAEGIAGRGINLPTWAGLSKDDVEYICNALIGLVLD